MSHAPSTSTSALPVTHFLPHHPSIYQQMIPAILLTVLASVLDVMTTLGVALGVFYILPLLATLSLQKPRVTLFLSLTATLLIVFGAMMSPEGGELWTVVLNRSISIMAVWVTYMVVLRNIRATGALQALHKEQMVESERFRKKGQDTRRAILNLLEDIEQSKHTVIESEARNRLVVEAAPSGMVMIDQTGSILLANKLIVKQFGFQEEELLGQPIETLLPERFRGAHPAHRAAFFAAPEPRAMGSGRDLYGLRRDGTEFPVEIGLNPLSTAEGKFVLASVVDITNRKQIEEDLKATNQDLMAARDEALVAVRTKAMFLATMSHEIRTPMNGILGMAELLCDTELSVDQHDLLHTLCSSGENLLTIINDILDFSKIESGKLTIEQIDFDLRTSVEEVLNIFTSQAEGKGLELVGFVHTNTPTALRGDPVRFRQILTNFVGNAIKFTATGEVFVQVTPFAVSDSHAHVRVDVKDTGIGMSDEEQKNLFHAFTQANQSTTRKFGGTGLGLAICRQLVELMQGEIGVDSTPGTGSCFWFTLKFPIQSTQPSKTRPEGALSTHRILFVDDHATNRFILDHYAESWGMHSSSASSGTQGLILLDAAAKEGRPFDLVVIDQKMPDMDGVEVADAIKTHPRWQELPLILLTSLGDRGQADKMKQVVFSGYLTKPIHQHALRRSVQQVLGLKQDSRDEKGSPFIVPHTVEEQALIEKPQILIAEDNLVNQKVAVKMLTKLGYQVDIANNGEEAYVAWKKKPYDIILMDCLMPEMDGYQATRKIREAEAVKYQEKQKNSPTPFRLTPHDSSHVPILAMTANAMEGDRKNCLDAGMDDFIAKPVNIQFLGQILEKWLSTKTSEERQQVAEPGYATSSTTSILSHPLSRT